MPTRMPLWQCARHRSHDDDPEPGQCVTHGHRWSEHGGHFFGAAGLAAAHSARRWQLGDLPSVWLRILPSVKFPLVRVRPDGALSRKNGCGFAVRPLTLAIPLGWSDES
jgi:hypothetical protein